MKLLPSLFSCVYSRLKLFVFAMNSKRRYSIFVCFIYGLEEKNSKSEVTFAVCRLPLTSCLTSLLSAQPNRNLFFGGLDLLQILHIPAVLLFETPWQICILFYCLFRGVVNEDISLVKKT